ncbi:hypothetical protein ACHHYP_03571 [Achlya hypogyna]|uniref:Uncharacterized protein n=1 Tax=Achlya hypogyna TaxID=1202772 RepID=A0A1V9ZR31_ACHHY|nr:hypothetical protein ACHHYP_03571 [Achlya hypogyna]
MASEHADVFTRLHLSPRKTAAQRSYALTVLHPPSARSPPKSAPSPRSPQRGASPPRSPTEPHIVLVGDPHDPHTLLKAVFHHFAGSRCSPRRCDPSILDGMGFAKFCRACPGLMGKNFGPADVDLTFAKVKLRCDRRISYPLFVEAIGLVALKKYPDKTLERAVRAVLDLHIATLPALEGAVVPKKSVEPLLSKELVEASGHVDKALVALGQLNRQVRYVAVEAAKSTPPRDLIDIDDRIKFAYMLQDEIHALIEVVPKSVPNRRQLISAVAGATAELDVAVAAVTKAKIAWQSAAPRPVIARRMSVPTTPLSEYINQRVKALEAKIPSERPPVVVHLHSADDSDDDGTDRNPFAAIFPTDEFT